MKKVYSAPELNIINIIEPNAIMLSGITGSQNEIKTTTLGQLR